MKFSHFAQDLGLRISFFFLASAEEIEETKQHHEMFEGVKRIPGIQIYHKFISVLDPINSISHV